MIFPFIIYSLLAEIDSNVIQSKSSFAILDVILAIEVVVTVDNVVERF